VVSLIERFYEPLSGSVLLDGHNITELDIKWLRSQIGLVNQEPALFATSIRENILYGKDDATINDINHAAKLSEAITFINHLPDRYETQVCALHNFIRSCFKIDCYGGKNNFFHIMCSEILSRASTIR
jgi:ATP-binding cassette, subfamily B (MDR/TAP), member 1